MVNDAQLLHTEREIHRLIARKQAAEQHIATLEARLYDLETEYLRETSSGHGSILKSLDGYHGLKASNTNNTNNGHKRFTEEERIFSRSSTHSYKHSVRLYRAASGHHHDDGDVDMHFGGNSNDELYFANGGQGDNTDDASVVSSTGGSPKRKKSSSSSSHKKRVRK